MAQGREYPLAVVLKAVDRLTAPLRGVSASVSRFGETAARAAQRMRALADRSGLPVVASAAANVGRQLGNVGRSISTVAAGISVAVGGIVGGLTMLSSGMARSAFETQIWAKRLGMPVEALQELGYAAGRYGVQQDALIDGIKELSLRADEFAVSGAGGAAEAFERLGLSQEEIAGTMGDTEALFGLVLNRLQQVSNVAKRQRLVDELFGGTGGEQMAEFVTATTEEMERLRQEARDLGVVLSEDAIDAAVGFHWELQRVQVALEGVRNVIGVAVLPQLTVLGQKLTEFVVKHRPQIEQFAQAFADKLPGYIETTVDVVQRLFNVLQPLWPVLGWMARNIELVAAGFATFIGLKVAVAVGALVQSVWALGAALAATPVGWFLGAVAAIAGAAYLIYANWEDVSAWFANLWANVEKVFDGYLDYVVGVFTLDFDRALGGLKTMAEGVRGYFTTFWSPVISAFQAVVEWVDTTFGLGLKEAMDAVWSRVQPIIDTIRAAIHGVMGGFENVLQLNRKVLGGVSSAFGSVAGWASDTWDGASSGLAGLFGGEAGAAATGQQVAAGQARTETRVEVDFRNIPRGTQISQSSEGPGEIDLNQGFALAY